MTRVVLIKTGYRSVRQHYSPPLGIMSLASYLRGRFPDMEIELIDMVAHDLTADDTAERALAGDPDLVGLSAMSYEAGAMSEVAAAVKSRKPDLTVIAGGPHATTAPERVLADTNIEFIVRGEGELTFEEFIENVLLGNGEPGRVKGLGYRQNGEPALAPPREQILDMDTIDLPAYDLIDLPRYWSLPRFGTTFVHPQYAVLSSSRACPYHCTYCHRIFGTRFRSQSAETVLRDLQTLAEKFGIREVQFVDDCFNLDKKRVIQICDGIILQNLEFAISFPNGLRGDLMDEEVLDKLKAAGTYRITYAVETASPRLQQFLKKHVKLEKLKKVIEMTDQRDIMVDGFFMLGFPGETKKEVEMTLDYALQSRLQSANFWFVTPFKGTELYDQAVEMGYDMVEEPSSMHYFDPETDLSEVPARELKQMVRKTFIRFYLNPWRLWRILKLFPNKKQLPALLVRAVKIALKWN